MSLAKEQKYIAALITAGVIAAGAIVAVIVMAVQKDHDDKKHKQPAPKHHTSAKVGPVPSHHHPQNSRPVAHPGNSHKKTHLLDVSPDSPFDAAFAAVPETGIITAAREAAKTAAGVSAASELASRTHGRAPTVEDLLAQGKARTMDEALAMIVAMAKGQAPAIAIPDQTGMLPPVFGTKGTEVSGKPPNRWGAYARPAGATQLDSAFDDGTLRDLDPEAASLLDRSMVTSGLPTHFYDSEEKLEEHKRIHMKRALDLAANPDASIEEILQAAPTHLYSNQQLRKAKHTERLLSQQVLPPVQRLVRTQVVSMFGPTPLPTAGPTMGDGTITPGQENFLLDISCATVGDPRFAERT